MSHTHENKHKAAGAPLLVMLPHTRLDSPFVVGSHHIFRRLSSRLGDKLFVIEPFVGIKERSTRNPGFNVVRPVSFIPLRASCPQILEKLLVANAALNQRLVRKLLRSSAPLSLILDNPYAYGFAASLKRAKQAHVTFRLTDWMPGQLESPWRETNFRLLRRCLALADEVIVTSTTLARYVTLLSGKSSRVITNGVGAEFVRPEEGASVSRKTDSILYYGAIDSRIDLDLLFELCRRLPQVNFVCFSPSEMAIKAAPNNFRRLPGIPYRDLPRVLSEHSFAILPFTDCASNHGRFPMKLYEMVASGLTVFSPPLKAVRGQNIPGLSLAPSFSIDAMESIIREELERQGKESVTDRERRTLAQLTAARLETWDHKVDQIYDLCTRRQS